LREEIHNVDAAEIERINAQRLNLKAEIINQLRGGLDDEISCRIDSQALNDIVEVLSKWLTVKIGLERAAAIKIALKEMRDKSYGSSSQDRDGGYRDAFEELSKK